MAQRWIASSAVLTALRAGMRDGDARHGIDVAACAVQIEATIDIVDPGISSASFAMKLFGDAIDMIHVAAVLAPHAMPVLHPAGDERRQHHRRRDDLRNRVANHRHDKEGKS